MYQRHLVGQSQYSHSNPLEDTNEHKKTEIHSLIKVVKSQQSISHPRQLSFQAEKMFDHFLGGAPTSRGSFFCWLVGLFVRSFVRPDF